MKKEFVIVGVFVLIALLLVGVVSADVSFTVNDGADVTDADFDIIKAGAYGSGDKVVFWMEVRGKINVNPPEGYYYTYSIDIYTNDDKYISVGIYGYTYSGYTVKYAWLTTESSTSALTEGTDYIISGNKISFYIDKTVENLWNSGVDTVDFYTGKTSGSWSTTHTDTATYSSAGGGTGESTGGTEEAPSMWLFFLPGILGIICIVIWIVIWLVIALWAYKDAKSRGDEHAVIWFLVVFFLGIIGLIIYLVIGRKEKKQQPPPQPYYYQQPPPPPPTQ